jgi:hypothetical protein
MKTRASDFWVQLKDKPAIAPHAVATVDIITDCKNPDDPKPWSFNVVLLTGDHFIFEYATEKQAKSARQSFKLQLAIKIGHLNGEIVRQLSNIVYQQTGGML